MILLVLLSIYTQSSDIPTRLCVNVDIVLCHNILFPESITHFAALDDASEVALCINYATHFQIFILLFLGITATVVYLKHVEDLSVRLQMTLKGKSSSE